MLLKCILLDLLTLKISLGTKSMFLAGLEIEISQKLDLAYGHSGHFEKRIFVHCLDTF